MSATVPPPSPPPPANPNQSLHHVDISELSMNVQSKNVKSQRQRWSKHFKPQQSCEVATSAKEPSKKSFIWDWLEGKLEKKTANYCYEGSSSSFGVSIQGPVLAPGPLRAVQGPQTVSIMLGSLDDNTNNLVGVYDPSSDTLIYMNINEYINVFGVPPPVLAPYQNFTELESNCIDVLQSGFSLEEVTDHKKEEKLSNEGNKVEEKKEKPLETYIRRSKMNSKVKVIQIGEIEVQVPLKPTGADETVNKKVDEMSRIEEDSQGSGVGN